MASQPPLVTVTRSKRTRTPDVPDNAITPELYTASLGAGCDVDWAKTTPGRKLYFKAKDKSGISIPKQFKDRGFGHVRIRVADHVDPTVSGEEINPDTGRSLLDEIAEMVSDCVAAEIMPIVAYQGLRFKEHPLDDEAVAEVVNWWDIVARKLQGVSYSCAYNFIIETTEEIQKHDDRLNLLYQEIHRRIRPYDYGRLFIVAPNKISNPEKLVDLVIPKHSGGSGPDDPQIFAEAHWYAAGPSRTNPRKLWDADSDGLGNEAEKDLLRAKIKACTDWMNATGRKVWVGAIMANDYNADGNPTETFPDGAPKGGDYPEPEQQIDFVQFVTASLRDAGIPVAWNSDTKFHDRQNFAFYESMKTVVDEILNY